MLRKHTVCLKIELHLKLCNVDIIYLFICASSSHVQITETLDVPNRV